MDNYNYYNITSLDKLSLLTKIDKIKHDIEILELELQGKIQDLDILSNELDCLRLDEELDEMENDD